MTDEQIIAVDSSSELMPAVFALRHEVFVLEQLVPLELERDEYDESATHLVALRDGDVIGTLRIVINVQSAKIGRMAVRATARRQGTGSRLMRRAGEAVLQKGVHEIVLHAQLTAKEFYRGLGYREQGDTFEEAGIAHVAMHKKLP